jgi:hypothetical protein
LYFECFHIYFIQWFWLIECPLIQQKILIRMTRCAETSWFWLVFVANVLSSLIQVQVLFTGFVWWVSN